MLRQLAASITEMKRWLCFGLSFVFAGALAGSLSLLSSPALGYYNLGAFWKMALPARFVFTTAPQTLNSGACSAIATVQAQNSSGFPFVVRSGSPLSLYLFGNNAVFFSDPGCTTPITGVTIAAGNSTASFYFESQATNPIEASIFPTRTIPAVQTETINTGSAITGYAYTNGNYSGYYFGDPSAASGPVGFLANLNNSLYMGYTNQWSTDEAFVSLYNGNDSSPSWSLTNSGNSIVYSHPANITPFIYSFAGNLYATWMESNGSYQQIRVKKFNGTTWSAADPGSLNISTSENAENPILTSYNGALYIAWDENNLVHVARYGGGTSWTRIDDNGSGGTNGTSMNYVSGNGALEPALIGTTSGLFAAWLEFDSGSLLRVKVFNGTSWSAADPGTGIQINGPDQYWENNVATFASINGKVYIGWEDVASNLGTARVKVYAGGTTWNSVDGSGLNYQMTSSASTPYLIAFQGMLYASWNENDTTSGVLNHVPQIRMAVYNGNDASPSWSPVGTPGTDGMDYLPWQELDNYQGNPTAMTVVNNKLYMVGLDSEDTDTWVFKQSTTPTQLWFPNFNASEDYDEPFLVAGCMPGEVRTADATGAVSYATASTTVTLSGTGLAFFSDDQCTQALPSSQVTIAAGDSGAHFFFFVTGTGATFTLGASASGLTSASESLSDPGSDVWTGGASCSGNWTDGNCWSAHGDPGQYGTAIFTNSACTVNCSATVNANVNVDNIVLQSDYTGTLSVAAGKTLSATSWGGTFEIQNGTFSPGSGTVVLDYFYQTGGTFNAGTSNTNIQYNYFQSGGTLNGNSSTFAIGGDIFLYGGIFNAPDSSGSLSLLTGGRSTLTTSGSPTFNTNGGTVYFPGLAPIIYPGSLVFNNVTFNSNWSSAGGIDIHGTLNVTGNLTVANNSNGYFGATTNTAVISVQGNVIAASGPGEEPGSFNTTLNMAGTTNQSITSAASCLPGSIVINNTGSGGNNTVSLSGTVYANNWTYTQGVVAAGTSTMTMNGQCATINDSVTQFNDFVDAASNSACGLAITGTLNIAGDLNIATGGTNPNLNGGAINLAGNLTLTQNNGGTTALNFVGGNSQTISYVAGTFPTGTITVNKTSGTSVSLLNTVSFSSTQALNVVSGTLDLNGFSISKVGNITIGDTLRGGVGGITARGNWTNNGNFNAGTSTVTFSGNSGATIGGSASTTFNNLIINKTGQTFTLADPIATTGNLTITAGTLAAAGYGMTIGGSWSNSGTFTSGNNTVTFSPGANHALSGATSFYNLTMNDSGNSAADTLTFPASTTTTISAGGTLTLKGNATNDLKLRSSTGGTQWTLTAPAGITIGPDLDVQDSKSTNAIHSGAGYVNSGNNNANWSFP